MIKLPHNPEMKNGITFESVRNGVFCELGKGSVDFKSIVNELNQNELQWTGLWLSRMFYLEWVNPKNVQRIIVNL